MKEYTKKANICSIQSTWRSHFKVKTAPYQLAILYDNDKLNKSGSVLHIPLKKPKISEKRLNAKNCIKLLIEENPALSLRKLCCAAEISYGMTQAYCDENLSSSPTNSRKHTCWSRQIMRNGSLSPNGSILCLKQTSNL